MRAHGQGLFEGTDDELNTERDRFARAQRQAFAHERLEARNRCRDFHGTRLDFLNREDARLIRDTLVRDVRVGTQDHHRDARHHSALVVRDGAGNGCARFLCPPWCGEQARAQDQRAQLDGARACGSAGAHPNPPDRAMWNKTNKPRVERRLKTTHLLNRGAGSVTGEPTDRTSD